MQLSLEPFTAAEQGISRERVRHPSGCNPSQRVTGYPHLTPLGCVRAQHRHAEDTLRLAGAPQLESLCAVGDIFTPNEVEAISMVGEGTPEEVRDVVTPYGCDENSNG